MAKRKTRGAVPGGRLRLLALALLLASFAAIAGWWHLIHWRPDRAAYPEQGVLLSAANGPVSPRALRAVGADFAYLAASSGENGRDPAFERTLAAAKAARLPAGAVHTYDPCVTAERQAANFVTIVPRDPALLPPVVALGRLADECADPVSDAAIESELTVFLNQIEGHAGKPALLRLSPEFEARYHIAARVERNLWLDRTRLTPDYAGRPWTIWTANPYFRSEATSGPVTWLAVRP